ARAPAGGPAADREAGADSVTPSALAMSGRRTPGSWAMQSRTRAWLVRKLSPPRRRLSQYSSRKILLVVSCKGKVDTGHRAWPSPMTRSPVAEGARRVHRLGRGCGGRIAADG